jgi:hypothetical protein
MKEVKRMLAGRIEEPIENWLEQPKRIARQLIGLYGQPDEVTDRRLVWHHNGLWKRSEIVNKEIPHRFSEPHHDSLTQVIAYRVPPEFAGRLLQFDGSILIDRTRGELAARCDSEAANYLALNLAHEIVTGKKTVDQAREFYADVVFEGKNKKYLKGFRFTLPTGDQADPDAPVKAGTATA